MAIAGGQAHSLALKSDGTVWAWGRGLDGQLGDGNFYTSPPFGVATPVQVSGLTAVTAIANGRYHSFAVKSDGTVWAWGRGYEGQLGDGNFYAGVAMPVQVSGLSQVRAIAGNDRGGLALKFDGTVWAWGEGASGQLGDGNFYTSPPFGVATPVQVSGFTGAVAIASAGLHCLALKSDGTVWTWGSNAFSALGDGNGDNVATPMQVSALGQPVSAIAAGFFHSLALPAVCTEPPLASYAVVKTPALFANPPRIVGWFQLLATDDCDPDPLIYLKGNAGSFVAGPFHNGDQVEIGHGPSLVPRQAPSTFGGNIATIQLNGDVLLWAVDSSGNASTPVKCK